MTLPSSKNCVGWKVRRPEMLQHPEAMRVLLPVLKGDARLYRRYVYQPGVPLPVPILAFSGNGRSQRPAGARGKVARADDRRLRAAAISGRPFLSADRA